MPSPDVTAFTDLTLYDRSPADLVDRAVSDAAVKLPDWVPRDGHTEVVLVESMALEVAELVYAVNRLPGAIVDVLLRLYGVTRNLGVAPTATATFTFSDAVGHTLDAGTAARLTLADGTVLTFTTDAPVVAAAGELTVDAQVTATTNTAAANGTPAGTVLELASAVPYVERVVLATDIAAGADEEADADWQARGVQAFERLTSSLVLPAHFTDYALGYAGVYRATTVDNYDPATGPAPGDNAGHVTTAVLGQGGAFLSAAAKADLEAQMSGAALANLSVHVVDPTLTAVNVTVTVAALAGYDPAVVHDDLVAALESFLSPDVWPWSGTVRRFELVTAINNVDGVDYIVSLDAPAADVVLAGVAPLTEAGVITVTVE